MKAYLWDVKYQSEFRSSSGSKQYEYNTEGACFLVTKYSTLEEVEKQLQIVLGNQYHMITLQGTTYLGEVANLKL
jgi:hypothetical protein